MNVTQTTSKTHAERIAEITAELAEQKRAYFVDGIERPMSVRVTLEAELANLRLAKIQANTAEKARRTQVLQLRGDLLRQALTEIGQAHLIDQCNAQAESLIPTIQTK